MNHKKDIFHTVMKKKDTHHIVIVMTEEKARDLYRLLNNSHLLGPFLVELYGEDVAEDVEETSQEIWDGLYETIGFDSVGCF